MDKEKRAWAKEILSHYGQEFEAYLIHEDDNFFIMDWKDKNGSGNLATRYIVDKKKGNLIITGDAGCCVASWYNEVTPEKLVVYINSTYYWMGKMKCTDHKYTWEFEAIEEDIRKLKEDSRQFLIDENKGDISDEELAKVDDDFERMEELLESCNMSEYMNYPDELVELFEKYGGSNWWEGSFTDIGQRIDNRIYLWEYGFQEGVERIRGEEFVRKDI